MVLDQRYRVDVGLGTDSVWERAYGIREEVYVREKEWEKDDASDDDPHSVHLVLRDREQDVDVATSRLVFPRCSCESWLFPWQREALVVAKDGRERRLVEGMGHIYSRGGYGMFAGEVSRFAVLKDKRGNSVAPVALALASLQAARMSGLTGVFVLVEKGMASFLSRQVGMQLVPVCSSFNHRSSQRSAWWIGVNHAAAVGGGRHKQASAFAGRSLRPHFWRLATFCSERFLNGGDICPATDREDCRVRWLSPPVSINFNEWQPMSPVNQVRDGGGDTSYRNYPRSSMGI